MNDNLSFQKYRISITTTITTLSVSVFASDQQPMAVTLHTMIVYCLALPHRCGDHRAYVLVSCATNVIDRCLQASMALLRVILQTLLLPHRGLVESCKYERFLCRC
jgi:hypothetical protein